MKSGVKNFFAIIICLLVFLTLVGIIYFNWIFSYDCKSLECFKAHEEKCSRAIYILDSEISTMKYQIIRNTNGLCEIEITNLQIKEGTVESKNLEGKFMNCFVKIGETKNPESDLKNCHGEFKEELQELIIKNMHAQIVKKLNENSTQINNSIM